VAPGGSARPTVLPDGPGMMDRVEYSFRGSWTVPFPLQPVHALLVDLERYPEWWPQVRAVASLGEDDAMVVCRSALPYSLDLHLHAERREPTHLEISLSGDLRGGARWYLADLGPETRMDFEQDVEVTGRLLRLGSGALRPLLSWNHERMMKGCVSGLQTRLAQERSPISPAP
jgi:carbon monoxide dehydrogenase subunit G